MCDQGVLVFDFGVRSNVHPVTEMVDIKSFVGEPVFESGEVL